MRISEGAVKAHLPRGRQPLSQALGLMADSTTAVVVAA